MTEKDVDLFNKNDGVHGRDGGPYADEVMGRYEEELRARREGRKPTAAGAKLPHPGVQLVNSHDLIQSYNSVAQASDERREFDGKIDAPVYAKAKIDVPEPEDTRRPAQKAADEKKAAAEKKAEGDDLGLNV